MAEEYYIGQIFEDVYPPSAAEWCNNHNCIMKELNPGYQIVVSPPLTPEEYADFINNLKMTALDFITFIKQAGLTDLEIELYLNSHLEVKHQLQFCQNVYCGVAKALMPITVEDKTITAEMVEQAFKLKNGVR